MDYYDQTIYIPCVTTDDVIEGKIERWEAHKAGILHRAFTVALIFENQVICQHRKHPVFDGFLDLTASSHQIYFGEELESPENAVLRCLKREWNLDEKDYSNPITLAGKVLYKATHLDFTEHEICHLYTANIKKLPEINLEFAYGYTVIPQIQLVKVNSQSELELKNPVFRGFAPWVTPMIEAGLLGSEILA